MPKKVSLSEKYSELINPAPLQDPEDEFDDEVTTAKVVEDFDDDSNDASYGPSSLRRQNAEILDDARYAGQKVSRKSLRESSDENSADGSQSENEMDQENGISASDGESGQSKDGEEGDDAESESEGPGVESESEGPGVESESEGPVVESESEGSAEDKEGLNETASGSGDSGGDDDEGDMFPAEEGAGDDQEEFQTFSKTDTGAEIEKGQAVRNQLSVWDSMLEMRIKLQKSLLAANQLPLSENFGSFTKGGGKEFTSAQSSCVNKVSGFLDKLTQLQDALLLKNPETKAIVKNGKKSQEPPESNNEEEITSSEESKDEDSESEARPKKRRKITDFSNSLTERHKQFLPFRNATIQKWSDKTRVSQGKISSKNFSAFEQSTVKQIEQILADRARLLKRSHLKRSSYRILGEPVASDDKEGEDEYCKEIYDDDDFYHQLLRELIEHKSEGVTDPIQLGRQWIAIQKLRNKMKRKIDTRATKGRKIRYVVHPKLVNFMAPYDKQTSWTEESRLELYRSLFSQS